MATAAEGALSGDGVPRAVGVSGGGGVRCCGGVCCCGGVLCGGGGGVPPPTAAAATRRGAIAASRPPLPPGLRVVTWGVVTWGVVTWGGGGEPGERAEGGWACGTRCERDGNGDGWEEVVVVVVVVIVVVVVVGGGGGGGVGVGWQAEALEAGRVDGECEVAGGSGAVWPGEVGTAGAAGAAGGRWSVCEHGESGGRGADGEPGCCSHWCRIAAAALRPALLAALSKPAAAAAQWGVLGEVVG